MIKSIDNVNLDLDVKKILSVNDITIKNNLVLTKKQAIQLIKNNNPVDILSLLDFLIERKLYIIWFVVYIKSNIEFVDIK